MAIVSIILFLSGLYSFFLKQKYITLIVIVVLAAHYFRFVDPFFNIGSFSFQHGDMALLLIFALLPFRKPLRGNELNGIRNALFLFFGFLVISILYDFLIRDTSPMQIFRTVRRTGYLFFFFMLNSFSYNDYLKLIKFIFFITIIHSILYISQYAVGFTLFSGRSFDNELGGVRFANPPTFLIPIFVYAVFSIIKSKRYSVYAIILLVTIVLAQSRGALVSAVSIILMYAVLSNKLKLFQTILVSLVIIIGYNVTLTFFPIIAQRFTHLFAEINYLSQMDYNSLNTFYHEGSFIFRWGVTYERLMYVLEDPIRIFLGVGYIPDMDINSPIFTLGTHSASLPTGFEQYNSVDILFPNIITRYGIFGSFIFLFLIFKFFVFSFKNKSIFFGKLLLTYLSSMLFISLINETFYNGFYFMFIFLFVGLTIREKHKILIQNNVN